MKDAPILVLKLSQKKREAAKPPRPLFTQWKTELNNSKNLKIILEVFENGFDLFFLQCLLKTLFVFNFEGCENQKELICYSHLGLLMRK